MYKELFDIENKAILIDLTKKTKEKEIQTGEFEADILCHDCEALLSKYETYARTVLYGGHPGKMESLHAQNFINPHGVEFTHVTGLNYKKFKLFLLSVLWRASISNRSFFSKVNLGPYEEKLRKNLLAGEPGPPHYFPCVMSSYRKNALPIEILGEPKRISKKSSGYSFLINGILYHYYVTHKVTAPWILEAVANEKGDLRVLSMPEEHGKKIINSFMGENLFK